MTTAQSLASGRTSAPAATNHAGIATSIVIPVYNERDNLPRLDTELTSIVASDSMSEHRPVEIILVEDGSTDGTSAYVDDLASTDPRYRALHLGRNRGQSAALAAGIDHARGHHIVTMDGDLQNDPADIPGLLDALGDGVDCVSGWRRDRHDPLSKRIPSRIQTHLAKLTGPDIHDFGCTLTAYTADALTDIDLWGEQHRYIPAQLYHQGYTVAEREVNHRPREHGESRYGLGRLVRGFVDLLFHIVWVRYSTRPMHLLGGVGLTAMLLGLNIGAVSVVERYLFGVPLDPRTPRLIFTALLLTFGLQLLVFGVLAEMLTKLHYRDRGAYRVERVIE